MLMVMLVAIGRHRWTIGGTIFAHVAARIGIAIIGKCWAT
jgi:hypothetical protein